MVKCCGYRARLYSRQNFFRRPLSELSNPALLVVAVVVVVLVTTVVVVVMVRAVVMVIVIVVLIMEEVEATAVFA